MYRCYRMLLIGAERRSCRPDLRERGRDLLQGLLMRLHSKEQHDRCANQQEYSIKDQLRLSRDSQAEQHAAGERRGCHRAALATSSSGYKIAKSITFRLPFSENEESSQHRVDYRFSAPNRPGGITG